MTTWGDVLREVVIPGLATVLLGVLSALAMIGIRYLERRLRIDVPAALERAVADQVIPGAVGYAEQMARRAVAGADQLPLDRLATAVEWAEQELRRRRLPELARDELERLIEARLGQDNTAAGRTATSRMNGAGARAPSGGAS